MAKYASPVVAYTRGLSSQSFNITHTPIHPLTLHPSVFQPRVSFDTFERQAEFIEENAFTRIVKHKDYEYTRRSRTFLCGYDDNEYSDYALQWLIDQLVDDGDEIVCLRVVEKDDTIAGGSSVEQGRYREEADALMKSIQGKNGENKAINLILEFAIGKVHKVIDEMVCFPANPHPEIELTQYTDQPLRARHSRRRHPRPFARRLPRLASGFRVKILLATLACPRHRRTTLI
jgi:hypothetical protein